MSKKNKHKSKSESLLSRTMNDDDELLAAKKVENRLKFYRNGGQSIGAARLSVSMEFKISLQEVDELMNLIRIKENRTMA